MAYIGRTPAAGRYEKLDDISGSFNGVLTQFNLTQNGSTATVFNAEQLMVSIGGVIQEPVTDYTITNNSQINFTSAPLATDTFFAVLLGDTLTGFTVPDRSITNSAFATSTDFTGRTFTNLTLNNPSLALANATSTFTVDPGVANTNIFSDNINVTANGTFTGDITFTGNVTGAGDPLTVDGIATANGVVLGRNTTFDKATRNRITNVLNVGGDGFGTSTLTLSMANSNHFYCELANNITLANPTNVVAGQSGAIVLKQDTTGSRTISFGTNWKFPSGVAPTLSTSANTADRLDYFVSNTFYIHAVATLNVS